MSDAAAPVPASRPPGSRPSASGAGPTFSPLVVLWMVLAGVFSFSAFMVLSAYAPDLRSGSDGGAHALSTSAVGYAGLVRMLRAEGDEVVISRQTSMPAPASSAASGQSQASDSAAASDAPATTTSSAAPAAAASAASDPDDDWSLFILTPDTDPPKGALANLTPQGPTLVVAPKWLTTPDPMNPAWVNQAGLIDAKPIEAMLGTIAGRLTLARRTDTSAALLVRPSGANPTLSGPIEQLQTFQTSPGLTPVIVDRRGGVVLASTADRRVYFLSDPDFLANHGIADVATARFANDLLHHLRDGDGPIAFDVSLNGFGAPPSLLKLAFSPPFLGATLCLAAVALLIGLHAAARFGAPRPAGRALAFGKRALADNSAALIRIARREPRMAGRYLDLTRNAVVKALGAGRVPPDELDAFLDRLAEKSGVTHRLAALVPETRAVKTRADLTKVAKSLYQWKMEMTGERR
jgi:hypothetical protein